MNRTLQVDMTWLNFAVGAVIPLLTGLVVKWKASSQLKAFVNLFLSTVGGALAVVVANSGSLQVKEFVAGIAATMVTSWGSYTGFWKNSGITDKLQQATANFGVGPSSLEDIVQSAFSDTEMTAIRGLIGEEVAKLSPTAQKAAAKAAAAAASSTEQAAPPAGTAIG